MRDEPSLLPRMWAAVALALVSALWLTADVAAWAVAVCIGGLVLGAVAAVTFGVLHLRRR